MAENAHADLPGAAARDFADGEVAVRRFARGASPFYLVGPVDYGSPEQEVADARRLARHYRVQVAELYDEPSGELRFLFARDVYTALHEAPELEEQGDDVHVLVGDDEVPSPASSAWAKIKAKWSEEYNNLYQEGLRKYAAAIGEDAEQFRPQLTATIGALTEAQQNLVRIAAILHDPRYVDIVNESDRVNYARLRVQYNDVAAGIYSGARTAAREEMPDLGDERWIGVAPAVIALAIIVVLGIAFITIGAVAWAVVAYDYVESLRDQTKVQKDDLDDRMRAMEEGKTLQPSTLPPPTPGTDFTGIAMVGITFLAAAAAAAMLLR